MKRNDPGRVRPQPPAVRTKPGCLPQRGEFVSATNARCRTPSDALHPESGMFSAPNEASIPRDSPDNRVTGPPSPTGPDRDSPDRSSDTNRSRTNPDRPRRTRQVGSSRARTKGAPPLRSLRTPAPHPAATGPLSTHRKRRIARRTYRPEADATHEHGPTR